MRTKRNKRTSLIVVLLLLILLISVGYAALSTELSITTNATIKKQSWDVHFANVQEKEGSVETTEEGKATIDETETNVTYTVNMDTPGQFYEFTVDVVNGGGIDAMIEPETLSKDVLTEEQSKYLSYSVTYSDGIEINEKDLLKAGERETLKVNLTYKRDEITSADLPTADDEISLTLTSTYVQADSNAVPRQPVETEPVEPKVEKEIGKLSVGDYVSIGGNNLLNDDEVFYNEGGTRAEWRVAKIDETNNTVTLILSDYLPTENITNAASMNMKLNANGYTLGWNDSEISNVDEAVATLTNSENWSHLLAGSNIEGKATITGGLTKEDVNDEIIAIRPHDKDFKGCYGYWLASAYSNIFVCCVTFSGNVGRSNSFYDDCDYGVCPAVSLESDILVEQIGENAWSIK